MEAAASESHSVTYDDFATAGDWPGDKWYRHLPIPGLWDPAAVVTCSGGPDGTLALEARRFTLTRRDGHDNVKALIYSTAEFGPGDGGMFGVAAAMRVTTFGTENSPYNVDPGDVRLGCGALNTIDLKTWMVFDFFVSGSRIVALYERLPFGAGADKSLPGLHRTDPDRCGDQARRMASLRDPLRSRPRPRRMGGRRTCRRHPRRGRRTARRAWTDR